MTTPVPPVASLSNMVPARDRAIPIEPALTPLFPDAGLHRGHVVACGGVAARSLAVAIAARAVAAGSWLAVVGVDGFGIEAAIEQGVAPERVVTVAADGVAEWAERLAAATDGFELVLTTPPRHERGVERAMRKLRQRFQARGAVLLVVPPPSRVDGRPPLGGDIELVTSDACWLGLDAGHGRLIARRVTIRSAGRRVPRPVTIDCWLPGPDGRVDVVQRGLAERDRPGDQPMVIHRAS